MTIFWQSGPALRRWRRRLWLLAAVLAVLGPVANAQEPRKGPAAKGDKAAKPGKAAKAEIQKGPISDTELSLSTIARPATRFVNFVPLWQAGPLLAGPLLEPPPVLLAPDAAVAPVLQYLAQGANPVVRGQLIAQLNAGNNGLAIAPLQEHLTRERDPRLLADTLLALTRLGGAALETYLRPWLAHADGQVRLHAIHLARRAPGSGPDLFRQRLRLEPLPELRRHLAAGLAMRHAETRPQDWEALLTDPDLGVRVVAWQELLRQGRVPCTVAEYLALPATERPVLAVTLAAGLNQTHDAGLSTALLATLAVGPHEAERRAAADCAARWQHAALPPWLAGLAQDARVAVRYAALRALPGYPGEVARQALLGQLGDPTSRRNQLAAREGLQRLAKAGVAVRPGLLTVLAEKAPHRRQAAAESLTELADPAAASAVAQALRDEPELAVRAALLPALAASQHPDALALLTPWQAASEASLRAAVAQAVAFLPEGGRDWLAQYLKSDSDMPVRVAALRSMAQLGEAANFSAPMIAALKTANANAIVPDMHLFRAELCWAAGHLRQAPPELVTALNQQILNKVIPTPMGPVHDALEVRANAVLAIASLMTRGLSAKNGQQALSDLAALDEAKMNEREIPPVLREQAAQGLAWAAAQEIVPGPIPWSEYRYTIERDSTRR